MEGSRLLFLRVLSCCWGGQLIGALELPGKDLSAGEEGKGHGGGDRAECGLSIHRLSPSCGLLIKQLSPH